MIRFNVKLPEKKAWRDESTSPENLFPIDDDDLVNMMLGRIADAQEKSNPLTRQDFNASNMGQLAILHSNGLIYIEEDKILLSSKGTHQLEYIKNRNLDATGHRKLVSEAMDEAGEYQAHTISNMCEKLAAAGVTQLYIKEIIQELEAVYMGAMHSVDDEDEAALEEFMENNSPPPDTLGDVLTMAVAMGFFIDSNQLINVKYLDDDSSQLLEEYLETVKLGTNDPILDTMNNDLSSIVYAISEI